MSRPISHRDRVLLLLATSLALFIATYQLFGLPEQGEVIRFAQARYEEWGLVLVLGAAIVEATLIVSIYLPGSVVLISAVPMVARGVFDLYALLVTIWLGFMLGGMVNYLLGRWGWYRILLALGFEDTLARARSRLESARRPWILMAASGYHPNVVAFIATAAGLLRFPLHSFAMALALTTAGWLVLWALLLRALGDRVLVLLDLRIVGVALLLWVISLLLLRSRKRIT